MKKQDTVYSKEEDGKFFLKELQSNGNLEWIEIQTNNGNKKKTSTHYELD